MVYYWTDRADNLSNPHSSIIAIPLEGLYRRGLPRLSTHIPIFDYCISIWIENKKGNDFRSLFLI
jgi:hypothetical protein